MKKGGGECRHGEDVHIPGARGEKLEIMINQATLLIRGCLFTWLAGLARL